MLADFLGDHDRAVLPSRATERDRQVTLAFMNVMRKQVDQQIGNARNELPGLRKRADIFRDAWIAPGQRAEFWNEVRVGQEAHVEDQVSVLRNSLTESETHARHQDALFRRFFLKALGDMRSQLVNIELGSVDHEIGSLANRAQMAAFGLERRFYRRVRAQGMRAARLTESADQHRVRRFQEDNFCRDETPNFFQDLGKFLQRRAFAHIDDQRGTPNLTRLDGQIGKLRDELDRQVVDAVVAQILKGLQHRSLPRAAHAGDDDQFRRVLRGAGRIVAYGLRLLRIRARGTTGLHALDSSIRPRPLLGVPDYSLRYQAFAAGLRGSTSRPVPAIASQESEIHIVFQRAWPVSYGVMKKFEELTEREVLALAIALEEEDERVYADFAEGLRQDYPATASMFDGMREEESGHRRRLLELFQKKFGEHIPLIRRQDVRGFVDRPALWLVRPLRIEAVRKEASTMEVETRRFYEKASARTQDASIRQLLDDLATEEREHEERAQELDKQRLPDNVKADEEVAQRRLFVLQIVQPGLAGLMDGSVSTLAPVFAAAFATQKSWDAFLVGLAASAGAGISMGFAEALSDDGSLTGRGHPWVRGVICGAMTALGGIGHTLPFLIHDFRAALWAAGAVVLAELGVITWVRKRYMDTPWISAALQVGLGGVLVFITGMLIGKYGG